MGDFCSLGVGSFNIFPTSPSFLRRQLSMAEARRCAEKDSKGDKCSGGPSRCDPKRGQREGAHALLAPSAGASSACENELDGEKLASSRLLVDSRSSPSVSGSSSLTSLSTCSSLAGFGDPLRCRGSFSLGSTSSRVLGTCNPLQDRGAEARSARKRGQVSVFQDSFVSCMSPSQRVLHVSQFLAQRSSTQDTRDMHAVTNSCGSVHGVLHGNSSVL